MQVRSVAIAQPIANRGTAAHPSGLFSSLAKGPRPRRAATGSAQGATEVKEPSTLLRRKASAKEASLKGCRESQAFSPAGV